MTNEPTFTPPHGDDELVRTYCAAIHARKHEVVEELRGLPPTTDSLKRADELLDELRERGRDIIRKCVDECGASAIVNQIDPNLLSGKRNFKNESAYAAVFAAKKELAAAVEAAKESSDKKSPRHTYGLQVECTDAALAKIVATMDKVGAYFRYAAPQTDKAAKSLSAWIESNLPKESGNE